MADLTRFVVPTRVLSGALYVPVHFDPVSGEPTPPDARPSGRNLTGGDIKLLWLIISHAHISAEGETITIRLQTIASMIGRVHVHRLLASLRRLQGTDVMLDGTVMPALVSFAAPEGDGERAWSFKLDERLLNHIHEGPHLTFPLHVLDGISSRYSVVMFGRFLAWKDKRYPTDQSIEIGAHPRGRAFQLDVPVDMLGPVFGFYDRMNPGDIKKLLVTSSKSCALRRELALANVAVDTVPLYDEISASRLNRLRLRISDIIVDGLADVSHEQKHKDIRRAHWRRKPRGESASGTGHANNAPDP